MTNKIQAGHDALWAVLQAAFSVPDDWRNVGDEHKAPRASDPSGMTRYVAQSDDMTPDVVGTMCGPTYDLLASPQLTFAYVGKTKAERLVAATADLETLKAAIAADRTLGGAVEHADIATSTQLTGGDWLAGGLEVSLELLFNAPTRSG